MHFSKKLPTIFFGHGSPTNAIENNAHTAIWQELSQKILPKPKAILSISAHWETFGSKITGNIQQKTIHDFYGFSPELYAVEYSARGDVDLAQKIHQKIPEIFIDNNWGLDHGTWSVLRHLYPDADIPTLQLSLDKNKSIIEHFEIAKKLRFLRDEGVLIIGSGNIVHNLRMMDWRREKTYFWAENFNKIICEALLKGDIRQILEFDKIDNSELSVPSLEHFLPAIYILALKENDENLELFCNEIDFSSIAMTGFLFNLTSIKSS